MPTRLKRIYGLRDLHFVTCSCYRRQPRLGTKYFRDIFLRVFEQVRRKYRFELVGYVVMPEHFHILVGEPEKGTPSRVLQVLKQTVAQRLLKSKRKRRSSQRIHRHFRAIAVVVITIGYGLIDRLGSPGTRAIDILPPRFGV